MILNANVFARKHAKQQTPQQKGGWQPPGRQELDASGPKAVSPIFRAALVQIG